MEIAAIMVLPVLLAAMFGALRIQHELSAASKLSVASVDAGIVVPAVDFVDRLDSLAFAGASGASGASIQEPPTQVDASAKALASLTTSAEFDPTVAASLRATLRGCQRFTNCKQPKRRHCQTWFRRRLRGQAPLRRRIRWQTPLGQRLTHEPN